HAEYRILKAVCPRHKGRRQLGTASALRPHKEGVEKRSASVRIDLYQPRTVFAEMEVVTHQRAERTMIPRYFGRPRQSGHLVRREPGCRLHSRYDFLHLGDCAGRKKNRHVREQVGSRVDERLTELRVACLARQRLAQRCAVKRDAKAGLIEVVRDGLLPIGGNGSWSIH
ncbi:MAG: hypothetical protein ACSLE4_06425, partial [Methyloceanibacter sp.]|uniref:hypothetical protein n=1 Tax=Methyloceanibacter sp. TaxID=1965321 RepID=UPI003EE384BF